MLLSCGLQQAPDVDVVSAARSPDPEERGAGVTRKRQSPSVIVVGTGIQWAAQTTAAAQGAIVAADRVLFAVTDPWAARWLTSLNERSESFEYPRDGTPRAQIYERWVLRVLESLNQGHNVCAVFYGSPAWLAQPAHWTIRRARESGYEARMLPGVSAIECLLAELGVDPGSLGLQVYEATSFVLGTNVYNPHAPLVLCQIGVMGQRNSLATTPRENVVRGLQLLSQKLGRHYPAGHRVILYEAAAGPYQSARIEEHSLEKLCDASPSPLSTLYVSPVAPSRVQPDILRELVLDEASPQKPAHDHSNGEF